jgi:hypothetical protein
LEVKKNLHIKLKVIRIKHEKLNHSLSMIPAAPIPVPMHILTKPYLPFVLFNSGINVAIYLAPVHPKGCPNAIAPPFGLTLFMSNPSLLQQ